MATEILPTAAAAAASSDSFRAEFWPLFLAAFNTAYRIVGERSAAEDVAADAMARAHLHWHKVGRLPHRRAWVVRVAANRALDVVRRKPLPLERERSASFEDATAVRVTVARALNGLPRRQREVVVLRYVSGLSNDEVAAALGINLTSVRTHLSRAVARLRDVLRELPDEEAIDVPDH